MIYLLNRKEPKIAVLIPCYNEAVTIGDTVKAYHEALPEAEIVVCDNNSTDGTNYLASQAGARVIYAHRQGKGNALRKLFQSVRADCYLLTDGDSTYSPSRAREMCGYILNGQADMVVGDRLSNSGYIDNPPPFHWFGNRIVRFLVNHLWKSEYRIDDVMTGLRALSPSFIRGLCLLSEGFEVETEMSVYAKETKKRIINIPIEYKERPAGSCSKLRTIPDGIRILCMIAEHRINKW